MPTLNGATIKNLNYQFSQSLDYGDLGNKKPLAITFQDSGGNQYQWTLEQPLRGAPTNLQFVNMNYEFTAITTAFLNRIPVSIDYIVLDPANPSNIWVSSMTLSA